MFGRSIKSRGPLILDLILLSLIAVWVTPLIVFLLVLASGLWPMSLSLWFEFRILCAGCYLLWGFASVFLIHRLSMRTSPVGKRRLLVFITCTAVVYALLVAVFGFDAAVHGYVRQSIDSQPTLIGRLLVHKGAKPTEKTLGRWTVECDGREFRVELVATGFSRTAVGFLRHGPCVLRLEQGRTIIDASYQWGKLHGEIEGWDYAEDTRVLRGEFVHGEPHGQWVWWYPDGKERAEARFDTGKIVLESWRYWDESGQAIDLATRRVEKRIGMMALRRDLLDVEDSDEN